MTEMVVKLAFRPRPWQVPLLADQSPRIVAVVHRRAGKSTALMWRGIRKALTHQRHHLVGRADPNRPGRMWTPEDVARSLRSDPVRIVHTLPNQVQWDRSGLWDRLCRAVQSIPGARCLQDKRRALFPNGSVYQTGGMDNPDSWRGGYADEIIIDECDDTAADGQVMAIEPMLADFGGTLLRSGTPKGLGRLRAAYDDAAGKPGHSRYLLRYTDTHVLTAEAVERLRAEMTEAEFAQEMECSFDTPNSGSYYGKLLQDAEMDGRICEVPHDPRLPVTTAWDLGMDNSTAIWFAQITRSGQWRVIDHISSSGSGLDHYVAELQRRPYKYARHLLPHDVEVNELGTGRSRREVLQSLGLTNIQTVPSGPGALTDGINAVMMVLPQCWFDERRCAKGLKSLRGYRREWNESAQVWRPKPVHDWASDDADAFRMLAMGAREEREVRVADRYARTWRPSRPRGSAWAA
jgi:hypothetical protein